MRYEIAEMDGGTLAPVNASGEVFYELGMMYASGRSVPADLVLAHKWFNLAAMRGNGDASRLRREIAEEMSAAEIAKAQRAARDWLTTH
jgi:TPR repeat protein